MKKFLLLFFIAGSAYGQSTAVHIAKHQLPIKSPVGINRRVFSELKPHRFILLGEMHGTIQAPAFVYGVVRLFKDHEQDLAVALELPESSQKAVDDFLANGDLSVLKKSDFFQSAPDGRSSEAMVLLLQRLRSTKTRVFCFDPGLSGSGQERDSGMAKNLVRFGHLNASATILVLTGNVHSMRSRGTPWDKAFRPMGFELVSLLDKKESVLSVKVRYESGSAWVCMPDCRVHELGNHPSTYGAGKYDHYFVMDSEIFEGHDATLFAREITSSPPNFAFKEASIER